MTFSVPSADSIPRPDPSGADAVFWDALRDEGVLKFERCAACGGFRHPPRPVCAQCGSAEAEWVTSGGTGEVWSFTVIHAPTLPAFMDQVPYGAVVVRLDEGVFLVSNLLDCPVDELTVGDRVELVATRVDDELTLPLFRRT
ncbi:MAG: hypothetical protein JWL73_998 [Actinomycetia bacterium]|nr:hypothetical protein [Actinomycetes bacterium]